MSAAVELLFEALDDNDEEALQRLPSSLVRDLLRLYREQVGGAVGDDLPTGSLHLEVVRDTEDRIVSIEIAVESCAVVTIKPKPAKLAELIPINPKKVTNGAA